MSYIDRNNQGKAYAPGYFLAHEECERVTKEFPVSGATSASNGAKYWKAGSFYPANSSGTVIGITYEDVDVSTGAMPGSVVVKGKVYLDRLPAAPESGVQSALEGKGFTFVTSAPKAIRPEYPTKLAAITVESAASSTTTGSTAITLSGYTKASKDKYVYKIAQSTAPSVKVGELLTSGWTTWDGTAELAVTTAKNGHKITVAVISEFGEAKAAGNATLAVKLS